MVFLKELSMKLCGGESHVEILIAMVGWRLQECKAMVYCQMCCYFCLHICVARLSIFHKLGANW
jgi:hypothetical protein